ncbi:NAD(P)H-flavin reductase [Legionella birminghamensis]|nr:NAD(P)H-flavin reductase [Legionella birminghamensis]
MDIIETTAQIESITPLSDNIIEIILSPARYVDYEAGQYLQIKSNDSYTCFSIANAPLGSRKYELHIRHTGNPYSQPLFTQIKEEGQVTIRLPYGDCCLSRLKPKKPILFIAGGTGFAPVKAMIEELLATSEPRPFELYRGARSKVDLYMDEKLKEWEAHSSHFKYFSLLPPESNFLAPLAIKKHPDDLMQYEIIIAGPFDMAYIVRDQLLAQGLSKSQLYSDAFSVSEGKKK